MSILSSTVTGISSGLYIVNLTDFVYIHSLGIKNRTLLSEQKAGKAKNLSITNKHLLDDEIWKIIFVKQRESYQLPIVVKMKTFLVMVPHSVHNYDFQLNYDYLIDEVKDAIREIITENNIGKQDFDFAFIDYEKSDGESNNYLTRGYKCNKNNKKNYVL